jgi:hypothetical protein
VVASSGASSIFASQTEPAGLSSDDRLLEDSCSSQEALLGGRKPSELLASMLELCPRGHETNIFFMHLFLERLPSKLRIILEEDDHQNMQALAERANALWSLHGMKTSFSASVASLVDIEEPSQVVAASSRSLSRGSRFNSPSGRGDNSYSCTATCSWRN